MRRFSVSTVICFVVCVTCLVERERDWLDFTVFLVVSFRRFGFGDLTERLSMDCIMDCNFRFLLTFCISN